MAEVQVRIVLETEVTCPLYLDLLHEPKKLPYAIPTAKIASKGLLYVA